MNLTREIGTGDSVPAVQNQILSYFRLDVRLCPLIGHVSRHARITKFDC
jgi:hypothetical protein